MNNKFPLLFCNLALSSLHFPWTFARFCEENPDFDENYKICFLCWVPGHLGPAIALVGASYTGCQPYVTVAILTLGVGLNGGIYSGFKVNHLDISPRFAGILMSFTNFTANMAGLAAPLVAGKLIDGRVSISLFSRSGCGHDFNGGNTRRWQSHAEI